MCSKHVGERLALRKRCTVIITTPKWRDQSPLTLGTCNAGCVFRWWEGLTLPGCVHKSTFPHYLPAPALGSEGVFMGWGMRTEAAMIVAKTMELDPRGAPDLGLTGTLRDLPAQANSVGVPEGLPSTACKRRF